MSKLQDAIDEVKRASAQHERDADWYNATARARRFAGTMSIENGWELAHLLRMDFGVDALLSVLPKPLEQHQQGGVMSHAYGQVRFSDGLVLHYRYYGTVDIALDALFDTASQVYNDWRSHTARACVCGEDEPVEIATEYGSGFSWGGRACRHCMAITAGFNPYDKTDGKYVVRNDGLPDWWVNGEEENKKMTACDLCGAEYPQLIRVASNDLSCSDAVVQRICIDCLAEICGNSRGKVGNSN